MLYLKALHIIFVVTWFSGLFYIVRLFIYHTETEQKPEKEILQKQFKVMEKRLWYGIAWPSMIGTFIFGYWMAFELYGWAFSAWLLLKLVFVFGLMLYHIQCHIIFRQLQNDVVKYSSLQLRFWNELATVFLVSIVFIAVFKNTISFIWGLIGLILFAAALTIGISLYRKNRREKKKEE